ncbi:MAG: anaerobic ribonucleoside-triphosphate reductase activating protein [Oscillospiraceae bacterium]|nr:anaerobic ribonucleoside-triphosphate reductase activating protein [Oscillospiraceae bacterium]
MRIVGLQKLTLLDYPGRVACTVFLGGCNFRCPFCHNSQLLEGDVPAAAEVDELLAFLNKRKGILDGVCITGGEPTIHPQLPDLLRQIKAMGYSVKLDTNGYRPDVLQAVVGEGLVDYVAMDVKNGPEAYGTTVGLAAPDLEKLEMSIRYLVEGNVDYELRTTVATPLHDEGSVEAMGQWLCKLSGGHKIRRLFVQPFVDRETVAVAGLAAPNSEMLERFVEILRPCAEKVELRGI